MFCCGVGTCTPKNAQGQDQPVRAVEGVRKEPPDRIPRSCTLARQAPWLVQTPRHLYVRFTGMSPAGTCHDNPMRHDGAATAKTTSKRARGLNIPILLTCCSNSRRILDAALKTLSFHPSPFTRCRRSRTQNTLLHQSRFTPQPPRQAHTPPLSLSPTTSFPRACSARQKWLASPQLR